MIERYIRDYVLKNWKEAKGGKSNGEISLGNTGMTVNDIRQHLKAELCIALYNFNPNYVTKEGRTVKESTFVYRHIFNRIGQTLKRLTKKRYGYGVRTANIDDILNENYGDEV